MNYLVSFAALPWQVPMQGVREKRFAHAGRALRLVEYSASMEPHWCQKGHIGQILEGTLELEFASGAVTVQGGEGLFIPPGPEHAHRARALTPKVTALFVEDSE